MNRRKIAERANDCARDSRAGGAPMLSAGSSRDAVIRWLQWNDPNACHTDELARREHTDPYDEQTAWDAPAAMVEDC